LRDNGRFLSVFEPKISENGQKEVKMVHFR